MYEPGRSTSSILSRRWKLFVIGGVCVTGILYLIVQLTAITALPHQQDARQELLRHGDGDISDVPVAIHADLDFEIQHAVLRARDPGRAQKLDSAMKILNPNAEGAEWPLGVSASERGVYETARASGTFVCIHSHERIDVSNINDDYCDCMDGTDEPGTAACPQSRFYCAPQEIFIISSRVGDGICDCCDGSDEQTRKPSCRDTCGNIRQEKIQRRERMERGRVMRMKFEEEAQAMQVSDPHMGIHGEFYPLSKECLRHKFAEFDYEVCLFSKVKQTDRSFRTVSLGNSFQWLEIGKVGVFEHGDACNPGQHRKTTVHFECSDATTLTSVSEPERCAYEVWVFVHEDDHDQDSKVRIETPAACPR